MGVVLALLYCKEGKLAAQDLLPVVLTLFPCYFFFLFFGGLASDKTVCVFERFSYRGDIFHSVSLKRTNYLPNYAGGTPLASM